MDLLEKLTRKPRRGKKEHRSNKRIPGQSIKNRPANVDNRKAYGHWEVDTVVGLKSKINAVLLTLAERQACFKVIVN